MLSDKRALLCYVTGLTQVQTISEGDKELTDDELFSLNQLVAEHQTGVPVPYLTGSQEFFSLNFKVNMDVMIPRPDTECLVEWLIANAPQGSRVIDLGTGSSCIAISFALSRPDCVVKASDISPRALVMARENVKQLNAPVEIFEGSWFDPLKGVFEPDVVVSNPPYIDPNDKCLNDLVFEPIIALTDFKDGLSAIKQIVLQAKERAAKLNILAIEHGWDQGQAVREIFESCGFTNPQTHKDYGGNDRFTTWQKNEQKTK